MYESGDPLQDLQTGEDGEVGSKLMTSLRSVEARQNLYSETRKHTGSK